MSPNSSNIGSLIVTNALAAQIGVDVKSRSSSTRGEDKVPLDMRMMIEQLAV